LAQLRQHHAGFVERDAEILVVGPDLPAVFKLYWAKEKLPFHGLADPKHTVADRYGQEVSLMKLGRMPAILIVDKKGRIRFTHYAENMRHYPTTQEMYEVLNSLQGKQAETGSHAA
jgi:peroxiredoxin Q/BCP